MLKFWVKIIKSNLSLTLKWLVLVLSSVNWRPDSPRHHATPAVCSATASDEREWMKQDYVLPPSGPLDWVSPHDKVRSDIRDGSCDSVTRLPRHHPQDWVVTSGERRISKNFANICLEQEMIIIMYIFLLNIMTYYSLHNASTGPRPGPR